MGQVRLDLVGGELVGRSAVVAGQAYDLSDVSLVGPGGEPSHRHVAQHAGMQLTPEPPPSGDGTEAIVSRAVEDRRAA